MMWFDPPVTVKTGPGTVRSVNSVEGCIEEMRTWPKVRAKLRAAYPICYGALERGEGADEARKAFAAAAKEAGVLISG